MELMTSSPKRWNRSMQRIKTTCRKTTTLKTSVRLTPTNQASLLLPCCGRPEHEEQESTALDAEVSQIDGVAGGSTEGHREQAESSGGKERAV